MCSKITHRILAIVAAGVLGIATLIGPLASPAQAAAVTATITVGTFPSGVAITPNGAFAYVINTAANNVSVINTADNTIVAGTPIALPSGASPRGIAIASTPNGAFAYVTNLGSNNVSVINTADNTVVGAPITLPVNAAPFGVAITPNGLFAYVTNDNSNNVSVIDTTTNTVVGFPIALPANANPRGVAITPNGAFAYVINNDLDNVSVIDTATNTVVGLPIALLANANPIGVAITPDGAFAYVTNNGPDNVSVISTATNAVVGLPISVGGSPSGVAITPNGLFAYVVNYNSNNVSVISTADAPTVTLINPTGGPAVGGTSVTITGTGIAAGATATIGGFPCTTPIVTPPTQITCTAPAGTAGAKNVVVTNIDNQSGTLTDGYTYADAPPPGPGPGPGTAQIPVNGCVTPPGTKAIPRAGLKRLTRPHCRTNAGQKVTTKVIGQLAPRGEVTLFKVIRKKNGAVFIRTYGYRLKLRITWSAPATGTYAAYKQTRTYRT